jgi:general stress protein YciG
MSYTRAWSHELKNGFSSGGFMEPVVTKKKRPLGFAALDPQRQREIASMGGKAAHASGRAHEFNTDEARAAGRKRHQSAKTPPGNA